MKSLIKITKLWKLFFLGALLLALNETSMAYSFTNPLPALPSSVTGASNLINSLNNQNPNTANSNLRQIGNAITTQTTTTSNPTQLVHELHLVTINNPSSVSLASYQQNYIDCANGGNYVGNSLVAIDATTFAYYCTLAINSWYSTTTKPVTYQTNANGTVTTYAQLLTGFIPFANPRLPASVGTEQITAAPAVQNGIPLTTILVQNCTNVSTPANTTPYYTIQWTSSAPPSGVAFVTFGYLYGNVSARIGLPGETDTPSTNASGASCGGYATIVAPLLPGQTITVNTNYSNLGDYFLSPFSSQPWNGNLAGSCNNDSYIYNLTGYLSYSYLYSITRYPTPAYAVNTYYPNQSNSCNGTYTVQPGDVGNTVYATCVCPSTSAFAFCGISAFGDPQEPSQWLGCSGPDYLSTSYSGFPSPW